MTTYQTIEADITKIKVDCIVNAANNKMLGGGGVDGAIHRAAGPKLLECCREFPLMDGNIRLPTGGVRITPAFDLPSKFIIHTAGPIWQGGTHDEAEQLEQCYDDALILASLHGTSVAFPAISTGIFGYPIEKACEIAVRTIVQFIEHYDTPLKNIFLVTYMSDEVSDCFEKMGIKNVSCDRIEDE